VPSVFYGKVSAEITHTDSHTSALMKDLPLISSSLRRVIRLTSEKLNSSLKGAVRTKMSILTSFAHLKLVQTCVSFFLMFGNLTVVVPR